MKYNFIIRLEVRVGLLSGKMTRSVLNGNIIDFERTDEDLFNVMDPNSLGPDGIQPGDLLEVKAKLIDKHANVTAFGTSETILKYDPSGPSVGELTGGVFGTTPNDSTYTIFSTDLINIFWSPFQELNPNESGLKEYSLSIQREILRLEENSTPFDTTLVASVDPLQPDTFFLRNYFLIMTPGM